MTKTGTGISNVLDGILSATTRADIAPATFTATPQPVIPKPAGHARSRRGRPLGKTATSAQPKEKITVWLSGALVASYRDWSWEARSQFSHLVEKALIDYHQRQRTPKSVVR